MSHRFDDALEAGVRWGERHSAAFGGQVHLVRDLHGRLRVVLPSEARAPGLEELHAALGCFSPGLSSISLPKEFFSDEDRAAAVQVGRGIWLVDRLVSEHNWSRAPFVRAGGPPRIAFFGVKGGVGRSTALVALTRRLTDPTAGGRARRVLVVDLDLESPGTTSMLLRPTELPKFGVVDWFVEDAVEQADDDLLRDMVATSRVGDALIAPAVGSRSVPEVDAKVLERDPGVALRDGAFIAKLGRAYATSRGEDFATRVERMLEALERVHEPDVVLIDSRAGMHDISAAVVPRLGATVLLFAAGTSQTWLAYQLLFSVWRRNVDVVRRFRDRLRVVAAQVPEVGRDAYLNRVRGSAFELFSGFAYEQAASGGPEPTDLYNYDVHAEDAPHSPIPIYWRREFLEWEPANVAAQDPVTSEQFDAAFGPFLRGVLALPYVGLDDDNEA